MNACASPASSADATLGASARLSPSANVPQTFFQLPTAASGPSFTLATFRVYVLRCPKFRDVPPLSLPQSAAIGVFAEIDGVGPPFIHVARRDTRNAAPLPFLFCAVIFAPMPAWSSMIRFTTARPMPAPWERVV